MKTIIGDELRLKRVNGEYYLSIKLFRTDLEIIHDLNTDDWRVSRILTRTTNEEEEGVFSEKYPVEFHLIEDSYLATHDAVLPKLDRFSSEEIMVSWLRVVVDRIEEVFRAFYCGVDYKGHCKDVEVG